MQTNLIQSNFFRLFEQSSGNATAMIRVPVQRATAESAPTALQFVTDAQRNVMQISPYAPFLRGKSLAEIKRLDDTIGKDLYKKSHLPDGERKLNEWRVTLSSAQTIALEAEYKKIDARFCAEESGVLYLVEADGAKTSVNYKYTPFRFDKVGTTRTSAPVHHLEFNSREIPSEISETGYRSHFLLCIPYGDVIDFADFLVKILRIHLNVKARIIFEEQIFRFDASLYPAPKPKTKRCDCPDCGNKLDRDNQCLDCDFTVGEDAPEDAD